MVQERTCKECKTVFKGGPRAYYCPGCRLERQREQNRDFNIRKKKGDYRKLGSSDKCERCGKEYVVEAGLQRFCKDCQKPHAIEHDRKTSIEFYKNNKDDINPQRNTRRRIGAKQCAWCGKKFQSSTRAVTCSDECKRQHVNKMYRERYKNKK